MNRAYRKTLFMKNTTPRSSLIGTEDSTDKSLLASKQSPHPLVPLVFFDPLVFIPPLVVAWIDHNRNNVS